MATRQPPDENFFEKQVFFDLRATFESLANTLPLSLLIKDADGRRLFANRAYLQLRGKQLGELLGKRDVDLFPPKVAKNYAEDDRKVLELGKSLHNIERTRDHRGRKIWIERVKSPIVDPNGNIIGLQLLFWDVTSRVKAEKNLIRERYFLTTLLDNIPDSIYFKDTESRFLRISTAMALKFGFQDASEVVGRTDADIFTAEHAESAREDELQIIRTGEPLVDRVERETWPDREDSWCMSTKMPLKDESGEIIGTFGISRDITELKQSQDALRAALKAAADANRAKSDFLANMSHEIRTPMNAIIGMTELLSQTKLTHEQRDYVDLVGQSADALLGLLNDILDFSKIEARKLELEFIPFSLREIIGKTGQTLALRATEKGLEIACRVAPDIPDRLQGDPGRLRQILINLISNAIKFTDAGEVAVDVSRVGPESDATVQLRFKVRDTGIGIPKEKQDQVLEAFTQADTSTTRRYGGTGLGLTISKQLVSLMGGELALESEPGKGTTFSFQVPLSVAAQQEVSAEERLSDLADLPVLVVDDNDTNRRILQEVFTSWRFRPSVASDGPRAIELFKKSSERGEPYPLVVVDCMMPDMDGFDVAKEIRSIAGPEQTRIIMLSSANRSGDVARCKSYGIARHMTKPVVQSELLESVLCTMDVVPSAGDEPKSGQLPHCPPLRVLVAEDGLANQQVVLGLLRAAGHHPVLAKDGSEAFELWKDESFDLILMDMHMPVMDGLEATQAIRDVERSSKRRTPIIALTAAAMPEDAEACRNAGMDDFLPKPIHPATLQSMMAKHAPEFPLGTTAETPATQQTQTDDGTSGPTAENGQQPNAQGANAELPQVHGSGDAGGEDYEAIDAEKAAGQVAGGMQGLRRLSAVFSDEASTLMDRIRSGLDSDSAAEVQRAAHTLKGSAKLFSANKVEEAAFKVESFAQQQDLAAASSAFPALENAVEPLLRDLERLSQ